jgi:hypothetical protein
VCIQLGDAGSRQDIPAYLHRQGHHVQTREESATRLSLLLVVARPPRDALLAPEPMPPTA